MTAYRQYYDESHSWNAQRARAGYTPYDEYKPKVVSTEPRDGYIDGGVVLKEGLLITHNEFLNLDQYTWKQFEAWAEAMTNLAVDELLERKLLWVYNTVPSITSMVA
jgi:hypothetical protein